MNKQTNKDMAAKIFRINYKSDFILTLESDAGWRTPFCIKFWTGAPSLAYFVGWDGETYTHCAYDPSEPSKLTVQFDDHHLPIGDLKYQVAYHFTVADFPNDTEDEVMNQASITTEIDGETYQVMLDFNGETAPEIQFALPAYANETQRIANEEQRIANEQQRIRNEETRIDNEQTRINQESARVNEYAGLKADAIAATGAANDAAALANQKAGLADDAATLATQKAGLAGDAATLATQKAGLADDAATLATQKAGLADDAATLATQKAGLADDAATLATQKARYAQDEGDYAKAQGDYAKSQADLIPADVMRTASDAAFVNANREALFYMRQADEHLAGLMTTAEHNKLAALPTDADLETGIIYDVSALHPTSGVSGGSTYASLSAALAVIPQAKRKGGMSVKFVQSSDNKYVQYRLISDEFSADVEDWEHAASAEDLEEGTVIPALAENLAAWADQKAIATPDTYTDVVRTTGGDIPIETSAGSKIESIKPVAGNKWTAKLLFNGSYNMLSAAKWGAANSQPYVGGVGNDFVYFLVPELTLGTFGTADENNGLLFTDSEGENVQPASVYFKPLGSTVPQSLTDGTSVTPTSVSYDGKTYKDYATDGAGWLIIPNTYYDNDVCAHIAWEDWYDKYVSLDEPNTNPEAVVGVLILEGLLALAHSDKYLRGVNDDVCDNVVFGDTSAIVTHMVDELSVAANAWTNSATGESDSHGNTLYRHSATVSGIKQGGAACVEGEDGGIPLTVNGTTVSYIDTNAAAPASVVFYEVTVTSTTKAYTDNVFSGSNINTETGVLPINGCSIEAQVAMDGKANITVKYAKNIVDQVAINATVDVPQIKEQVEEHEERITELEDTAVRTGSYDASVAVGLADNFKGDTIVDAEFYKRKTGGTQSVGSGIAAIKEVRGKSIVWNQLVGNGNFAQGGNTPSQWSGYQVCDNSNEDYININSGSSNFHSATARHIEGHKYYIHFKWRVKDSNAFCVVLGNTAAIIRGSVDNWVEFKQIRTATNSWPNTYGSIGFVPQPNKTVDINKKVGVNLIDLTLMFGAGNEPATVAEFEKMFPLDYYDYNKGEIIPFAGQNLTTTGKNQYNPATGKANLLGGQTYQIGGTYTNATIDGVAVTLDSNNCFTTTKDCVLDVTGDNATDTIVALYNGENVTYEPYEKHTLHLDPSQWRDKNGELVFPYGGMYGVGTAYDYAKVDADGYIRKAVRRFGQVDLGSLNWTYYNRFITTDLNGLFKNYGDSSKIPNFICSKYEVIRRADSSIKDKCVSIPLSGEFVDIKDSSYSDAATFKAAISGVMLVYELAEPVEIELATPVYAKYLVDQNGTEEITPANGTTPYTTMANLSILYAMDARGEIKNLPKNYLSKESAENMLNAMVSAGVIASYTMTWDAANNRYAFVITAPVEPEETNN